MTHVARLLLAGLLALAALPGWSQRFGYIDSEYILGKMPEYAAAQTELGKLSDTWQKEIAALKRDIDKLRSTYAAEEVVLTDAMRKKRQDEILLKEKELAAYETRQFGYEGQLFKKRIELNKPAQDKIFEACEKVVKARKLDFLFDRNGDLTMLYASPTHDYTEYVLEELGLASPTRNQPGAKGNVKTVTPPGISNRAPGLSTPPAGAGTGSSDPSFQSDSGSENDLKTPAKRQATQKAAQREKP